MQTRVISRSVNLDDLFVFFDFISRRLRFCKGIEGRPFNYNPAFLSIGT